MKKNNSNVIRYSKSRILDFLKADSTRNYDIKTICEELKIKKESVRVYLHRLFFDGKIERVARGLYRYRAERSINLKEEMEQAPILFHHIHLKRKCNENHTDTLTDITPKIILNQKRKIIIKRNKESIEVIIAATENPLSASELLSYLELLGKIYDLDFEAHPECWDICSIDINKDIEGCRLDGLKCFTLRDINSKILYRSYNKNQNLRLETSVGAKVVPFSEVWAFLKGQGLPGAADLSKSIKELNLGIQRLSRTNQKIEKRLDYLGIIEGIPNKDVKANPSEFVSALEIYKKVKSKKS